MSKLDVRALLGRGGEMTPSEVKQLRRELTEAKLHEMSSGIVEQTLDQPVRVIPFSGTPPAFASGYFTQQKFIWGKTPEEMERILGIIDKLKHGACVLQFLAPLKASDYENKAYSYLPNGKEYKPDPNEKMYVPGKGAPQWRLTRQVTAKCIAKLLPGQPFDKSSLNL